MIQMFADNTRETLAGVIDPTVEENPQEAFNYFRQSTQAYDQKQLDQAILLGRKALSADLEQKEYFLHLANLYGLKEDYQTGLQILKAATDKFPKDYELQDALSVYAYYLKDYELAKEASDQAVSLTSEEAEVYYHQGKIYGAMGDYDQAVQSLKFATYLKKKNARYQHDLAVYLFKQGKIDEAIEQAKKAAKLASSKKEEYYVTLGVLYLKKWEQVYQDKNMNAEEKKKNLPATPNLLSGLSMMQWMKNPNIRERNITVPWLTICTDISSPPIRQRKKPPNMIRKILSTTINWESPAWGWETKKER